MTGNMRREFDNRDELIAYLKEQFPDAAAIDNHISETRGGRKAAEEILEQIDPQRYAKSRNYLNGAVTKLSAYIRYGVLSLAEVKNTILAKVNNQNDATKLINELGWRDYWQRLYSELGDDIWKNREPSKTGYSERDYDNTIPADIINSQTGLVCIDNFSCQLRETGYLHNHARMWMAAYIVHWRRICWQAGAKWFLEHLLDGDPASNNLSWQWVASTFSHKAYFFNRENLEKYTEGVYCRQCSLYGNCDFEGSYEELEKRLFSKAQSFENLSGSQSWQRGKRR